VILAIHSFDRTQLSKQIQPHFYLFIVLFAIFN
jgi:hypothetical protein